MDQPNVLNLSNFLVFLGMLIFCIHRIKIIRGSPSGRYKPMFCPRSSLGHVSKIPAAYYAAKKGEKGMDAKKLFTGLFVFLLTVSLCAVSYAQDRGRILSTSEQQYQNLVLNGSLEAFSAGVSSAPDGYVAAGLATGAGTIERDATAKYQAYSAKLTQSNTTGTYTLRYNTAVAGFGANVSDATTAVADLATTEWQKLTLYSANGYTASVWIKLPGGAANPTSVALKTDADEKIYVEIDSDTSGDYCYIDGLQITEGPIAPAFVNAAITDTGDQRIFGDLTILNPSNSADYIILDKDTGTITASGGISATATNANTLDNIDSSQFLRSDTADSFTSGVLSMATGTTLNVNSGAVLSVDGTWNIDGTTVTPTAAEINILSGGLSAAELDPALLTVAEGNAAYINITGDTITGDLTFGNATTDVLMLDTSVAMDQSLNDSSILRLRARYDSNAAVPTLTAATSDADIIHNVTAQSGASALDFNIGGGSAEMSLDSSGNLTVAGAVNGITMDNVLTSLTEGTGIVISGSGNSRTITNSDLGSSQFIFKNITDGTNTAAADINSDTLTLSSANNMLGISVNAAADSATFTVNQGNIDHGAISGLGDDDHPQYAALAQNESVSGAWTFANDTTVNSAATATDALTVKAEGLTTGNVIKARINADATSGNIIHVTDDAATPVAKFVVDKTGAITTGSIPWTGVSSKPSLVNTVTGGSGVTVSSNSGDITLGTSAAVSNTTSSYSTGNAYSLVTHMQAIGSGVVSANNPHGLNYVDVGASAAGHDHDAAYINDGAGEINSAEDFGFASSTFIANLDSDLLDGQQGAYYLNTSGAAQTKAGDLSVHGNVTLGNNSTDTIVLNSQAAGDALAIDSPALYFRGSYDANPAGGSVTATDYDAAIVHNLSDTAPNSALEFNIAGGTAEMSLDNSGNLVVAGMINSQTIGATTNLATLNTSGDFTVNQNSGVANDVYFSIQHNSANLFTVDKEGDLYVAGNLQVEGDQVILNVQTMEVESNKILLNRGITGSPYAQGASIEVERGTSANTSVKWNEASTRWEVTNDGTNFIPLGGDISATYLVNSASGILTNEIVTSSLPQSLAIKGNAAASRTITLGQQAANADVVNIDVPSANFRIGGSQISSSNLSDGANIAHINVAETISANWVNTANPWADNEVANDLTISGGTVNNTVIGGSQAAAGTFTALTVTSTVNLPDNSVSMADIAWTAGQSLLTPEYPNGTHYGDGSSNNGTLALKNTADANWRNYYEWTSQSPTLQDYTVTVRHILPPDFSSWAASNAVKLAYATNTAVNTDNKVDVIIYKSGSASSITSSLANVSADWTELVIDDSSLGSWSAGDVLVIEIKTHSKSGNHARIGDITLNYAR
jgi:hypothetical protein